MTETLGESFPFSPSPPPRLFAFMGPSLKCTAQKREVHFPMYSRTNKQVNKGVLERDQVACSVDLRRPRALLFGMKAAGARKRPRGPSHKVVAF